MTSARPTLSRHLRNLFLGGLVVVVPIVLTVNALVWLFRLVDGLAGPLTEAVLGRPVPGIGFATTVAVVFLAGFLVSFGPLKKLLVAVEQLLDASTVLGVGHRGPVRPEGPCVAVAVDDHGQFDRGPPGRSSGGPRPPG